MEGGPLAGWLAVAERDGLKRKLAKQLGIHVLPPNLHTQSVVQPNIRLLSTQSSVVTRNLASRGHLGTAHRRGLLPLPPPLLPAPLRRVGIDEDIRCLVFDECLDELDQFSVGQPGGRRERLLVGFGVGVVAFVDRSRRGCVVRSAGLQCRGRVRVVSPDLMTRFHSNDSREDGLLPPWSGNSDGFPEDYRWDVVAVCGGEVLVKRYGLRQEKQSFVPDILEIAVAVRVHFKSRSALASQSSSAELMLLSAVVTAVLVLPLLLSQS
ncbi:hypothetical protein BKA80DRAFT_257708 [Phyllosticta citrichinensis]